MKHSTGQVRLLQPRAGMQVHRVVQLQYNGIQGLRLRCLLQQASLVCVAGWSWHERVAVPETSLAVKVA